MYQTSLAMLRGTFSPIARYVLYVEKALIANPCLLLYDEESSYPEDYRQEWVRTHYGHSQDGYPLVVYEYQRYSCRVAL